MNDGPPYLTALTIVANVIFSLKGFRSTQHFDRYAFEVEAILWRRELYRVITSGFLHVNLPHLFLNMYSLFAFGPSIERICGTPLFAGIYFGSLVAGSAVTLLIHRNHPDYRAAGASGAISGVVFSFVFLFPDRRLIVFPIPLGIPGWIFAILFTLISIYGIRSQLGNIGHAAHLGGALGGLAITATAFHYLVADRLPVIAAISIPAVVFTILLARRPYLIGMSVRRPSLGSGWPPGRLARRRQDQAEGEDPHRRELDELLDKVSVHGLQSLTPRERKRLEKLSGKTARR